MPHPAVLGAAVYVAWQLGYFDSWGWSSKPPNPEDLDPETLRDVVAKFGSGGSGASTGIGDFGEKIPFSPRKCPCPDGSLSPQCCDDIGPEDIWPPLNEVDLHPDYKFDEVGAAFDPCDCCAKPPHSEICCETCEEMGGSTGKSAFWPPGLIPADPRPKGSRQLENRINSKSMKPHKLRKTVMEELRKLKENKGLLTELAPAVAWWIAYGLGFTGGAVGGAWYGGFFDTSVPPPKPGDLSIDELTRVIQEFGTPELIDKWNENPKLAYDIIKNPSKYKSSRGISPPKGQGGTTNYCCDTQRCYCDDPSHPNYVGETGSTAGPEPVKQPWSDLGIDEDIDPRIFDDLVPPIDNKPCPCWNGEVRYDCCHRGGWGMFGEGKNNNINEIAPWWMRKIVRPWWGDTLPSDDPGNTPVGQTGIGACPNECEADFDGSCGEAAPLCDVGGCRCHDGTSYNCCFGAEKTGNYLRENVSPEFTNNMENLYASKGCTGLKKKLGQLNLKFKKVQQRTGAGAGNWSDQVKARITHLDNMMQSLGCGGPAGGTI